jgi:hypothetical protein
MLGVLEFGNGSSRKEYWDEVPDHCRKPGYQSSRASGNGLHMRLEVWLAQNTSYGRKFASFSIADSRALEVNTE